MASTRLLDRIVYDVSTAAHLLDIAPSTLVWWLCGRVADGRVHLPVLRDEVNDDRLLTWGDFVSAQVLRMLRRERKVDLQDLRTFAHHLRATTQLKYPLAEREIILNGSKLAKPAQLAGMEEVIFEDSTGQLLPGAAVRMFVDRVKWRDGEAVALRIDDRHPRVEVDPRSRRGHPQIEGVSTAAVYELAQAGESVEAIADMWNVSPDIIHDAVAFEERNERAAA